MISNSKVNIATMRLASIRKIFASKFRFRVDSKRDLTTKMIWTKISVVSSIRGVLKSREEPFANLRRIIFERHVSIHRSRKLSKLTRRINLVRSPMRNKLHSFKGKFRMRRDRSGVDDDYKGYTSTFNLNPSARAESSPAARTRSSFAST